MHATFPATYPRVPGPGLRARSRGRCTSHREVAGSGTIFDLAYPFLYDVTVRPSTARACTMVMVWREDGSSLYTASALISLDFQSRLDPQDIGATQSCTACDWEGLGAVFYRWAWLVYRSEFEGMISCYDSDRHSHCNSICHPSATGMQCSSDQGRDINTRKYIARANASQLRAHYKFVHMTWQRLLKSWRWPCSRTLSVTVDLLSSAK